MDSTHRRSQRENLGKRLRELREFAGFNGERIGAQIGVSQRTVSRIETGERRITDDELTAWLNAVNADDRTREEITALAQAAQAEIVAWRIAMRGKDHLQDRAQAMERDAGLIRNFQCAIVPGLLQVPDYTLRMLAQHNHSGLGDPHAVVAARMQRQSALFRPDKHFEFLLTEAALRWNPGREGVVAAQLDRLVQISLRSNVRLGVIPLGAVVTWHPFILFEEVTFEDGGQAPPYVEIESLHGVAHVDDPESVAIYRTAYAKLADHAYYGDEARELIHRIAEDMGEPLR